METLTHRLDASAHTGEHEDDDALPPLARYIFEGFECFVYEYGIAAIRDRATRETKIARMDKRAKAQIILLRTASIKVARAMA